MLLARVRQKKMKTIQVDTPAVPERDISVLHMEAKDSELVEQLRENEYDIVSDILEELFGNFWEDIDAADKQSEEEDPCVPQSEMEKDQTYVHKFEKVEMEVTAHLQINVVEDNLVDNTPNNMGGEENSPAKHLEKTVRTSNSNKREKRLNYLDSYIDNFENYDPVACRLRGGNPAEKVTEPPQSMVEDKTSKVEMVSTSNIVVAKEKPQCEHGEKDDKNSDLNKRPKRPLGVSNMNNNVKDYTSDSWRGGNPQVKKVKGRKASRCLSCEPCMRADCGLCSRCQDMVKYGGRGRMKKACQERICENMLVAPGTKL